MCDYQDTMCSNFKTKDFQINFWNTIILKTGKGGQEKKKKIEEGLKVCINYKENRGKN